MKKNYIIGSVGSGKNARKYKILTKYDIKKISNNS